MLRFHFIKTPCLNEGKEKKGTHENTNSDPRTHKVVVMALFLSSLFGCYCLYALVCFMSDLFKCSGVVLMSPLKRVSSNLVDQTQVTSSSVFKSDLDVLGAGADHDCHIMTHRHS